MTPARVRGPSKAPAYDLGVFVNCPFDDDFLPTLHAIVFAIHDCGFTARIAVEDTGSNETRLDKIARIIRETRYSVHDISRVEVSATSLPRFNMAFECGLALGAIRYGSRPGRDFLFMTAEPFQDKKTLSDLSGQDPKAHRNDPQMAVSAIRAFLSAKKTPSKTRGASSIWTRYLKFQKELPRIAARLDLTATEVRSFDYVRDFLAIVSEWIFADAATVATAARGFAKKRS